MQSVLIFCTLLAAFTMSAQQSNTHFSHTLTTSAPADAIWRIWTDVPNWKNWDDGLRSAELQGDFKIGTKGLLIPDKGPKSTFKITEFQSGQYYTFRTKLPLGRLYVRRILRVEGERTYFTHEVWFKGLTKGIFGRALGRRYRQILPVVMGKIKAIAEQ